MTILLFLGILFLIYLHYNNPLSLDVEKLRQNLANPKTRGNWGEKIAEDLLKQAGFKENVHYLKQSTDSEGNRPDFTLLLCNGIKCNMDSKFPLTNYMEYNRTNDTIYITKFLKDFKDRIKEVSSKSYIGIGTTDFAIAFIPNDQILNFALEHDPQLMDFALNQRVIICSPWTLYATLAVIKQVSTLLNIDTEIMERTQKIQKFTKEWEKYKEELDKADKKLVDLNTVLDNVKGVRVRQLEKTLTSFGE